MIRGKPLQPLPGAEAPADLPGDLAVTVPSPSGGLPPVGRSVPALPERTLADLLAEVILRGKSPQTRRAYRADLEDFLIWRLGGPLRLPADPEALRADPAIGAALQTALGSLQLVTEGDIAAYLRRLGGGEAGARPLQPATINRRLTPLRLLFARLHRHGLIAVDPLEDIKGHKLGRVSATLWLTRPQARALEEACRGEGLRDLRDRALIVVMLATGLRSAEILGLAVADLGQVEGYHVAWIVGKGGARERVKLQDKARRALDAWLAAAEVADGPVFRRLYRLRPAGEQPGAAPAFRVHGPLSYAGLKFILRERFAAAGLSGQLSPHSLRHSFVTLALRGGAPLAKVQHAARHANPQTTMRYAHEQDALDDNAADYVKW